MKRKTLRLIALSLCVVLMAAAVVDTAPVSAYAVTQTEIDALKAERDAIKAQRQETQAVVEQLEADKASVVEQKQAMDERNMYTLQQIQLNSDEIAMYDEMIADKEKELTEAQRLEDEQLERYRARVRAMEENGSVGYLAMVLKTSSLGDFLTAMDDIGEIMQSDRDLEDAYIAARENTEEVKADYEAYRADINAKQEVLREEQAELEKDIEEAINLILDIENDLEKRQAEYDEIMAAEDAANANIDKLVAELEEQRRAEQANSGGSTGGGGAVGNGSFIWPVASYVYVSSRFGLRIHPITGQQKTHTGIDIASNQGTSIYAADGEIGRAHV